MHHDHEVVGIPDDPVRGFSVVATGRPFESGGHVALPGLGEVLVEDRECDVGQQRREDAPLGRAGLGVPRHAVLGEDAGMEERLHQPHDTLVPDPMSHPVHKGRVVDLVEARRDVTFQHPGVVIGCQHVNLGDGVVGPASRTEAVTARLEVRLEDRLEDQLQAGLHAAVPGGGDAEAPELARRLGDHPFPHGQRHEPPCLEVISQQGKDRVAPEDDVARFHAIDSGRPCSPIAPHPSPRQP